MSLNAVVYCDCVERQRLKVPHPRPELLFIDDTGYPNIRSNDPHDEDLHDQWEAQSPCSHEHFHLVEHWLGTVASVGEIRQKLEQLSENPSIEYPVLMSRIIYDGSHSGDSLGGEEIVHLRDEIARLRRIDNTGPDGTQWNDFLSKLEDLIKGSLNVRKPISF
jgi:hypothetical protein